MPKCKGGARHWFAYPGEVGSSSPTCTRYGCEVENPRYEPEADTRAGTVVYVDRYGDKRRARLTDTVEETFADRWEGTDYNGRDNSSGLPVVLHWNAETETWAEVER
jgi:hypothetical protein